MGHGLRRRLAATAVVTTLLVAGAALQGQGAVAADPATLAAARCEGLAPIVTGARVVCSHGGDALPGARSTTTRDADTPIAPAPCPGNGRRGKRLVVFYGYPSDTTPHAATFRPAIRAALALADRNLDDATPGIAGQHYRFWCETDRRVTIRSIPLLPIGADGSFTFGDVIASLSARVANGLGTEDFDDPRRVYTVFVDNVACCYGAAGQGTVYLDDRADPAANWNNVGGPHYSMVRLGFDPTFTALAYQHEVGHNLGAVQDSAPHSTLAGHCADELDVMCYADGGPYFATGSLLSLCPTPGVNGIEPWDCGRDDYYAAEPEPGSYLDTHWNLASSGWLTWNA